MRHFCLLYLTLLGLYFIISLVYGISLSHHDRLLQYFGRIIFIYIYYE